MVGPHSDARVVLFDRDDGIPEDAFSRNASLDLLAEALCPADEMPLARSENERQHGLESTCRMEVSQKKQ